MPSVPTSATADRLGLRLDPGLRARLIEAAAREHRTMSGQAIYLIERGLEAATPTPSQRFFDSFEKGVTTPMPVEVAE